MAAETEAADGRGTLWAAGALLCAIGLHWRDHPGRSFFLFASPAVMMVLIYFAMWPIFILQQTTDVPPVVFFAPILAVQTLMGYLIGRGSPSGFPFAGLLYFLVTMVVLPAAVFAYLAPMRANIVTGDNASWFGLAPIFGILISYATVVLGARFGYAKRAARASL